jgi:hypothetical protein
LSAQSTSTPASSSIATSLLTIAYFFASLRAPAAIVTDNTVGIATGIAATVRTNARELQRRQNRFAAIDREANDDGHHDQRQDDQIVADF